MGKQEVCWHEERDTAALGSNLLLAGCIRRSMTNDKNRMTNEIRSPNDEKAAKSGLFVLRHSDFVICPLREPPASLS
jgi:hypothetical protein